MKKVSIITACINLIHENRKEFFQQMFESIQNQTYSNIEHIVIDGDSKDGSVEFIEELISKADNPKITIKFISEPDSGVYNAMNKGVRHSSGEYFIFMNSDDYYTSKDSIKRLVETLENNSADLSASAVEAIDEERNKKKIKKAKPKKFVWRMPLCHQTLLSKRELFDKFGGLDENYLISADYDYLFKSLVNGAKIAKTDEALVAFRTCGMCSQYSAVAAENNLSILEKNYGPNVDKILINKIYTQDIGLLDYLKIRKTDFDPKLKQALVEQLNLRFFLGNLLRFRGVKQYIKSRLN